MNKFDRLSLLLLTLVLSAPLCYKAFYVNRCIYNLTAVNYLGAVSVVQHDAAVYSLMLFLALLSFTVTSSKATYVTARSVAGLIFVVYLLDLIILMNFHTHLVFADVRKYATYSLKYVIQNSDAKIIGLFLLVAPLLYPLLKLILWQHRLSNRSASYALAVIISLGSTAFLPTNTSYANSWLYENIFEYNSTVMSEASCYSDAFIANREKPDEGTMCTSHAPTTKKVVIVMMESLSSYQSKLFSGIRDWTPNLDRMAKENVYFTNFYANGFTTADGEIAILTGRFPIPPPSGYNNGAGASFCGFFNYGRSLPYLFKKKGYKTEFITSADLAFSQTGKWAESIGFDHVEGNEHSFYQGWPRFHFNAAPDEALYARVLQRLSEKDQANKFIFVKTVSGHHPFKNPENGNRSEEEAFRYADRQLGRFYASLLRSGFFNDGILIIVGDHHAMVPLKSEEIARYGADRAVAAVPMVYADGKRKAIRVAEHFQQVDIHNSLSNLISDTSCTSDWAGSFSGEVIPARYVIHRRGDERNLVSVFAEEEDILVKLDGDQTGILSPEGFQGKNIISKINDARIAVVGK